MVSSQAGYVSLDHHSLDHGDRRSGSVAHHLAAGMCLAGWGDRGIAGGTGGLVGAGELGAALDISIRTGLVSVVEAFVVIGGLKIGADRPGAAGKNYQGC